MRGVRHTNVFIFWSVPKALYQGENGFPTHRREIELYPEFKTHRGNKS